MLHSHLGEDFSVQIDTLFLLDADQFAVCEPMEADGVIESDNPEGPIRPFFRSSVAVRVFSSLDDGFLRRAVMGIPTPFVSLGRFQYVFSSLRGGYAPFYSCHMLE